MKFLSFNWRGLASTHKQSSLKILVERTKSDVIFLQETLGLGSATKNLLSRILPGWEFLVLDAKGRSGGLATRWKMTTCRLVNSWGYYSCLGVDIFS
jgi:exonuclease III